jgi:hypothetical protein
MLYSLNDPLQNTPHQEETRTLKDIFRLILSPRDVIILGTA